MIKFIYLEVTMNYKLNIEGGVIFNGNSESSNTFVMECRRKFRMVLNSAPVVEPQL